MKQRTLLITSATIAVAALAVGITSAATAGQGGDDNEQPIRGDALIRASEAALAHTGGGTVPETEIDDEESKYEVEVTLEDGTQVDVQLDENFQVVGSEVDDDSADGEDSD